MPLPRRLSPVPSPGPRPREEASTPAAGPPAADAAGTSLWHNLAPEKQDQVFRAAVAEFAAHGYQAASMNTLVRRAGISKGSLFTYFPSKSGLFEAVVARAAARIREDLRRLRDESAGRPFAARLEALLRAGFAFLEQHPLLARIYFRLLQVGEAPGGRRQAEALRARSRDFLAELVAEGQARGDLRRDLPAARVAFLLNLQLEALLWAWQEEGAALRGAARAARREAWISDCLSLALAGMAARSAADQGDGS